MFQHIVIPVDGSDRSATALAVGVRMSRHCGATLVVVNVGGESDLASRRMRLEDQVSNAIFADGGKAPNVDIVITTTSRSISEEVTDTIASLAKPLVCMATHGRNRTAAIMGSVANEILALMHSPVLLIGPEFTPDSFDPTGPVVVALHSEKTSESILPAATWWSRTFGSSLELVTVLEPALARVSSESDPFGAGRTDSIDSSQVGREARQAQEQTGNVVNFEVLHSKQIAQALLDRVEFCDASLLAMATHGATGLTRIATGSITSEVVRRSRCPLLVMQPEA